MAMLLGMPGYAYAQACTEPGPVESRSSWAPLLGQSVTLHVRNLPLRSALEEVAARARIRLSYSADLLPSTGTVCVTWNDIPAGEALLRLVGGKLEPVVAGGDLVVLTPREEPEPRPDAEPPAVIALDPMLVTADAVAPERRSDVVMKDVIDGRELSRQSATTIASALNGIPGLWIWDQPTAGVAQYGSLRGASSFGLSTPKVYIDGIEVANPLLLTRLSPDAIDRVEVIRGPQGSALYGADALGGVTNIITRHGARSAGAPRTQVRAGFGLGSSAFTTGGSLEQNHSIGVALGSELRSASLDVALGSLGAFVPGTFSEHVTANASGRLVAPNRVITGTLRLFAQESGTPTSPLLDSLSLALPQPAALGATQTRDEVSLRQYTLAVNAIFSSSPVWTHTLVAGFDGYVLDGVPDVRSPWLTPTDSALRAAGSNAIRGTLRMSSAAQFINSDQGSATLTLSAEHSVLRQRGGFEMLSGDHVETSRESPAGGGRFEPRNMIEPGNAILFDDALLQRTNTGLSARIDANLSDRLFVTGGVRMERDGGASLASRVAALPTLGGAYVFGSGPVSVKLRAAYGKGIRWPQLPTQLGPAALHEAVRFDIGPEEQSGIEAGFDLTVHRALSLRVTRFDQTATGRINQVAMRDSSVDDYGVSHLTSLQNLGEIKNRGWELQATARRGQLSVAGAASFVDSRVADIEGDLNGELRVGDRMLAVPARTFSLTGSWDAGTWSASLTGYRAADWTNYDRIALARALTIPQQPGGSSIHLRDYWREYGGNTHLRATFARDVRRGMTLFITGDNLLNLQVGEPDNITIVPGRTFSVGLRASF